MGSQVAREHIAFGEKERFDTGPLIAPFVPNRAPIGAGTTLTSKPIRIDHMSDFGLAVYVILVDSLGNALYGLDYQILIYSEGIDGSNAEYKGQIFGPWVSIVAGAVLNVASYTIGGATFPATQAIRLRITNNGAVAPAGAPNPTIPEDLGFGLHVRVAERSKP